MVGCSKLYTNLMGSVLCIFLLKRQKGKVEEERLMRMVLMTVFPFWNDEVLTMP